MLTLTPEWLQSQRNYSSIIESFWKRVSKSDTCWMWTGIVDKNGYGVVGARSTLKTPLKSHRLSWIIHGGTIPSGMCVLHRCDVPGCVNPEHLFIGTSSENTADRDAKGRTTKGSKQHLAKLTEDIVRIARRRKNLLHISTGQLARDYGVTFHAMALALRGETWKHVD